ncbi:ArnT family glycosyltransferase [Bacteroides ihuae]|uniref:ArnT family glycosyltransferase n=1 Tax=Bacteroides ihuae TaxID=1852362 RepID=UPI000B10FC7A|nr:dolichyl-phosphate-mannose--protein mannosyltransferase [Bacteroides ihuae]
MKFILRSPYFFLGVLLALLPVILLRDFTPANELRYLSIADEAMSHGDLFTFTNHGIAYADKPPLYFWIIMFGKWLLGSHYMWFLSLASLIPAFVVIHIMDKWVAKEINDLGRFTAKFMLMSTGLFLGLSVTLRMDMLMCMFITLSLCTFYKIYTGANNKLDTFLFPFYIFMALFSKGPIGLLIPLLSTIIFLYQKKRIKTVALYWGWKTWSVLLAGCLIWFTGVYIEDGIGYLSNLLLNQTIGRSVNSFHHKEPFYYYFVSFWYSLAPWSLLIAGVILSAFKKGIIKTDLERLFMVIIVVSFILLSCISSKLAVYLTPIFPFLVYLTILIMQRLTWNRWLALSVALPTVCLSLAFLLPLFPDSFVHFDLNNPILYVAIGLLSLSAWSALFLLYGKRKIEQSIIALATGIFISVFVAAWALPSLNPELGYADLCAVAKKVGDERHIYKYTAFGLKRADNMDVFLKHNVEIATSDSLQDDKYSPSILIIKNSDIKSQGSIRFLSTILKGKEVHTVGPYSVIVLTNDKQRK